MFGAFYENELQKINQKEFRVEKVIKKKGNNLYVKWKDYDFLTIWMIKKTYYKWVNIFLNQDLWGEMWNLDYIFLIMLQKQI